jgi:hypothetical protein
LHKRRLAKPGLGNPVAFETKAVCDLDLEGIVAKRLRDPYWPRRTAWWKILNRNYSQKKGRAELFDRSQSGNRRGA